MVPGILPYLSNKWGAFQIGSALFAFFRGAALVRCQGFEHGHGLGVVFGNAELPCVAFAVDPPGQGAGHAAAVKADKAPVVRAVVVADVGLHAAYNCFFLLKPRAAYAEALHLLIQQKIVAQLRLCLGRERKPPLPVIERDRRSFPRIEDLDGVIRTMFKECKDADLKAKVKAIIAEYGKLNDVDEDGLKKIYDMMR